MKSTNPTHGIGSKTNMIKELVVKCMYTTNGLLKFVHIKIETVITHDGSRLDQEYTLMSVSSAFWYGMEKQ